jgi:hypothetical protein
MKIPKAKAIAAELHEIARQITKAKLSENQRYTAGQQVGALKRSLSGLIKVGKEERPPVTIGPRITTTQAMQDTHDQPIAPPPHNIGARHITERNPDSLLPEVEEDEVEVLDNYRVQPGKPLVEAPSDTEDPVA